VDELDHAVSQIAWEVRPVVSCAILAQAAGDEDLGKSVGERELDVGVGFVVAQRMLKRGLRCLMRLFSRASASCSLATRM